MAFEVVWTAPALAQRKAVLTYWLRRNGSAVYPTKLDQRFRSALRLIGRNPKLGRPTSFPGVRVKVVGDYLLFYRLEREVIEVLALWDARQDPERLQL